MTVSGKVQKFVIDARMIRELGLRGDAAASFSSVPKVPARTSGK